MLSWRTLDRCSQWLGQTFLPWRWRSLEEWQPSVETPSLSPAPSWFWFLARRTWTSRFAWITLAAGIGSLAFQHLLHPLVRIDGPTGWAASTFWVSLGWYPYQVAFVPPASLWALPPISFLTTASLLDRLWVSTSVLYAGVIWSAAWVAWTRSRGFWRDLDYLPIQPWAPQLARLSIYGIPFAAVCVLVCAIPLVLVHLTGDLPLSESVPGAAGGLVTGCAALCAAMVLQVVIGASVAEWFPRPSAISVLVAVGITAVLTMGMRLELGVSAYPPIVPWNLWANGFVAFVCFGLALRTRPRQLDANGGVRGTQTERPFSSREQTPRHEVDYPLHG